MAGHRGDFYQNYLELGLEPKHDIKNYGDYEDYLKNSTSVPALLCKKYNLKNLNWAKGGVGNYSQLDKLFNLLFNGKIKENDIVFFGLSTFSRDRVRYTEEYRKLVNRSNKAEFMVDRDLYNNNPLQICKHDHIMFCSTLEKLAKYYNFKLVLFNLWNNAFFEDVTLIKGMGFDFIIGYQYTQNTWFDILNDQWGNMNHQFFNFTSLDKISAEYRHLFSWDAHPSQLGYEKILNWIIDNKIIEKCLT